MNKYGGLIRTHRIFGAVKFVDKKNRM